MKPLLLSLTMALSFYAVADGYPQQSVFNHLGYYNNVDIVSDIFDNKDIASKLHLLLGSDYDTFIINFVGVGEPHRTPEGGLFIEGWPDHLYLEQASALVLQPDGSLYAAWKIPGIDKIEYRSSQGKTDTIQREIVQWASRFEHSSFKDDNRLLPPTSSWFSTKHFDIKLTSLCHTQDPYCDKFIYKGIRKADGSAISLTGQALRQSCEQSVCPILSYSFRNQDTVYVLDVSSSELVVSRSGKTLLQEAGSWLADFSGKWDAGNESDTGDATLSVRLSQQGARLTGSYCYVVSKGNRTACASVDGIHGTVEGERAVISFDSTFGGKQGKVELLKEGERIAWKRVQESQHSDDYAPVNADRMTRTADK